MLAPMAPITSDPGLQRLFPTLTPGQLARIAVHGQRRQTSSGEVLVEVGDKRVPFFVVVNGEVEAVRPTAGGETLIATQQAGQFTGEANMLSGRRAIARLRVSVGGEVIQLAREEVLGLIQTDAELSEIGRASCRERVKIGGGEG